MAPNEAKEAIVNKFFCRRGVYRFTILAALATLLGASSALAQMCASNAGNSPGDIVQTWTDFWDQGVNGFSWEVYINGTPWRDYGGVEDLTASSGCLHQCKPLRFLARTSNVSISNGVTGGNASGWKCAQITQIVGHDEGPIKSEKKARAIRNAEIFDAAAIVFGLVIPVSCNPVAPEPYTCTAALTGNPVSQLIAWNFRRIAQRDPWNGDYMTIDFPGPMPSAEDMGLYYTDDYYQNQAIGDVLGLIQMVTFILEEVDKYESCQMADVDCLAQGVDHAGAIDAVFKWYVSYYLNDLSNNAWVIAWIAEQNGGAAETVQAWRDLAQTAGDEAAGFQQ